MKISISILFCFLFQILCAQTPDPIIVLTQGTETSLRGLHVVSDKIIWASGSNGYIARSTNGGASFSFQQMFAHEKAELRDIYAFDSAHALVMSSVQPGAIFQTENGGKTWNMVLEDKRPEAFFDGMDFWDEKNGICFGDPIQNRFAIYTTTDGGVSWNLMDTLTSPFAKDGTAAFAASGSSIQCLKNGKVYFATGGTEAVLFFSDDYGKTWKRIETPMPCGYQSSGIFSIDFINEKEGCIVGGDYTTTHTKSKNCFYTTNAGKTWKPAGTLPAGYRSGVKYAEGYFVVTCGTSGVDFGYTDSHHFFNVNTGNYNVIATDHSRKIVFLAGNNGIISRLPEK